MPEQMSDSLNVEQIMEQIRERVRLRKQAGNGNAMTGPAAFIPASPERVAATLSLYDLSGIHHNVAFSNMLWDQVGTINPRRPGLFNDLIQLAKKAIRRALTWYTRPLHEFNSAVTRTLNETVRAVENLQENVTATSKRVDSLVQRVDSLTDSQSKQELLNQGIAALEAQLVQHVDSLADSQDSLVQRVDSLTDSQSKLADRLNANIQQMKVEVMACADTHLGAKAQEGLWFNDPIILQYDREGRPSWARTSERIVEKAWVLRHLGGIGSGARILDVGCTESSLSLELASNGFRVTGIDVRPYPLRHPNFHFVRGDIATAPLPSAFFDAAILLSTIEHIGLGWYGDPKGETIQSNAIAQIYRLLKPGGRLLVTVPFGKPADTPLHRIFDARQLRRLLNDFKIEVVEYGVKTDDRTWLVPASEEEAESREHDPETHAPYAVALAVCEKASRKTL